MNKMEKFLEKWYTHEFSTGCYAGGDYLKFQREFRSLLKVIAADAGCVLHKFTKNHYCCSAVLKNQATGDFIYISISDVRGFPCAWARNILYRTMAHDADWTGGPNHFSSLQYLAENLKQLNW